MTEQFNSPVKFSNDITVKLVRSSAEDSFVVQAAQVSVTGENNPDTDMPRLINALMKDRHGSPFEHNSFTFFVKAPIFVFREWHRHRIGQSFNEMSGRYTELLPEFYSPAEDRPLLNEGTQMRPKLVKGSGADQLHLVSGDIEVCEAAWRNYQSRLDRGIVKEIAVRILPTTVYSQMYWTVNARALMNFISLRVESDESLVKSYPQWEIQLGAKQIEAAFAEKMPITHATFVANGRVAP